MANKRMFSLTVVDSDAFLDMPLSAQCLYFHLNMRADDDGFIGNPKRIQRLIGASEDDLKLLIVKRFVLTFDSGVIVVKHWRMHNTLSSNRYSETVYTEEKSCLLLKDNKSYSFNSGEPLDDKKKVKSSKRQTRRNIDATKTDTDIGLGIDIDLDKGIDKDISIAQSDFIAHEPEIITITLNDKTEYPIYQTMINEWIELYPNVDVMQELRNMKGWCNSNPTKRKTTRGILRFITGWLSREQDKPNFNKQNIELPAWYDQTTDDTIQDVSDEEIKRLQNGLHQKIKAYEENNG